MARTIRIGFLGNCFIFGYPGVAARDTFPEVARRRIEAERPGVQVELVRGAVYHPADLGRQVSRFLAKQPPEVLIVDAPASPVAAIGRPRVDVRGLPTAAARLIDGAQQGLSVLRAFSNRHGVIRPAVRAVDLVSRLMVDRKVIPLERHAPPTLDDYERFLDEAIGLVTAAPATTLIVQGPSGFNHDESHQLFKPGTLELYRDVNAMVKRVTATHDVTMIDRQQFIEGADHTLFLGNTVRMSAAGHLATGHALASAILAAHIP
jgi:hypothetical protein